MSTPEQRRAALEIANDVRMRRAALKQELRVGRVTMQDLLADPPEWLRGARLYDVMRAMPRVGPSAVSWALHRASVPTATTFGMLSDGQRRRLLDEIAKAPRWSRMPEANRR